MTRLVPLLVVLLGALAFVGHRDRAHGAALRVQARGDFWHAVDTDGAPLLLPRNEPGVRLTTGDVLQLDEPESELHRYETLAFRVAKLDTGAFVQIDLRADGQAAYRIVVVPGDPVGVFAVWREGDGEPVVLERAQLPRPDSDPFAPLRINLRLGGPRFSVSVDDEPAIRVLDERLAHGAVSLSARDGSIMLRALQAKGSSTDQSGRRESFTWFDDLGDLQAASPWPRRQRSALIAAAFLLAWFGWVAACWCGRGTRGPAGGVVLGASVGLMPLAAVAVLAWGHRVARPIGSGQEWLVPFAWGAALLGCALCWKVLAAVSSGSGPGNPVARRPWSLAIGVVLTALAAWSASEHVGRALEPLHAAEQEALALAPPAPVPDRPQVDLGPHDALLEPGPWRDVEIRADVVLQPHSALQLRLRARDPQVPAGVTFVLPSDPRRRTTFMREEAWTFEPLGSGSPAVAPERSHALRITADGRRFRAFLDGALVAEARSLAHPSGAIVGMAAPGSVRLTNLVVRSPGTAADAVPGAGLERLLAGLWIAGLILLVAGLAAWLLDVPWIRAWEAAAYAGLPLVAALWLASAGGRMGTTLTAHAAVASVLIAAQGAWVQRSSAASGSSGAGRLAPKLGLVLACAALCPWAITSATRRQLVPANAMLNGMSYTHWRGERLEPDLLYLTHPLARRWNHYLAQHRFRGRAFAVPKPPGTRRVIALGGSSTWGFRLPVDLRADWPSQLEELLATRDDPGGPVEVEVVNAAYPGAIGDRLYRLLRDALLPFEPDLVVLSLYYNDSFALSRGNEQQYLAQVTAPGFTRPAWAALADQREDERSKRALKDIMAAFARGKDEHTTAALWDGLDHADPPSPPERFAAMLTRFAQLARDEQFELVLVKEPVAGDQVKLWKPEFYAAMDRVAAEYGLIVVDPRPALAARGEAHLFVDEIHPTPAGNAVLAGELLPVVTEHLGL